MSTHAKYFDAKAKLVFACTRMVFCVCLCVTLYPWMSPFWVSSGGVSQVTSRVEGDTADTVMDCGATDGAAAGENFR